MAVLFLFLLFQWIPIKEMSGPIPDNPGLTIETSASEIARGDDLVKLSVRMDFPQGAPWSVFRESVPPSFDVSSISRFEFKVQLNCKTLTVTPIKGSGDVYQFNGKKHKSKESPFQISQANVFAQYFCEFEDPKPSGPPVLKKPH